MSTTHRRFGAVTIDWLTWALTGLMLVFQVATLAFTARILDVSIQQPEQTTSFAVGAELLVLAAVEITVLLLAYRAYKYLPDRWQYRVKVTLMAILGVTVFAFGALLYQAAGLLVEYLILCPLFMGIGYYVDWSGYNWIPFNVIALSMGVLFATGAGFGLSPAVLLLIMAAFTVYDHLAVNLSDIMADLIELSANGGIPNFIIIPNQLQCDLSRAKQALTSGEKPDDMAMMIGVGDFVFPTALAISAFVSTETVTPAVVGAVAGTTVATVVLRHSLEGADGGLPALPWLNTGSAVGFGVGVLVSGKPVLVALGL